MINIQPPTAKWIKMSEVYKFFSRTYTGMDYSDQARVKMFNAETYGKEYNFEYFETINGLYNGYAVGKHLMDIQLAMWVEDLNQFNQLNKRELFLDTELEPIRWFMMEFFGFTQEFYDTLLKNEKTKTVTLSTDNETIHGYINI